jgi:hypothetical protein
LFSHCALNSCRLSITNVGEYSLSVSDDVFVTLGSDPEAHPEDLAS